MKFPKVFFLFVVFITGCGGSDFSAKKQTSQLDPGFLSKILASIGRQVSYRDYPEFVANSHLGAAETSESAYCKLNRSDVTRFSNRYSRHVNQAFNSFKVEIPRSCDSFKGFGETVGEMECQDPNGCGGYESINPGETVGEMECQDPNGCDGYGPLNPGGPENQPKDPGPGNPQIGFPGSECKVSWEFLPGYICADFFPGVFLCCPGGLGPR